MDLTIPQSTPVPWPPQRRKAFVIQIRQKRNNGVGLGNTLFSFLFKLLTSTRDVRVLMEIAIKFFQNKYPPTLWSDLSSLESQIG